MSPDESIQAAVVTWRPFCFFFTSFSAISAYLVIQ